MKELQHGQYAFIDIWGRDYFFSIGTTEGYAREYNECPHKAYERAISRGHDLAYSIGQTSALSDSRDFYQAKEAKKALAIELKNCEYVWLEGRKYTVKINGKRYADPVQFIPA